MINTILFDLDATLARMDQDTYIDTYLKKLGAKVAQQGYDPQSFLKALWTGTGAMLKNDGSMTNEELFWKVFSQAGIPDYEKFMPILDDFYGNDFDSIGVITEPNPYAADMIATLRRKGYKVGLATSPVFPRVATEFRIGWAGLKPQDFDIITTYENSRHSKPNPAYYQDVLTAIGSDASECLMVGNDVDEDMCTTDMGMSVYLVTDYLLNRHGKDYSHYPQGTMADLAAYLETLPDLRFTYRHTAQYYETDQMGYIHHSNFIRWFEEARVAWMDSVGYGYDVMEKTGVGSPVLGVQCSYKTPVHFHETVLIRLKIKEFTGTRLTIDYEVTDEATGALRATGETKHCFTDMTTGRPVSLKRVSPEAYKIFNELK